MHGLVELAVGLVVGVGAVVKETVGKRAVETLMEQQKQQGDLYAFVGEAVNISIAVAFKQRMGAHFRRS